MQEEIKIIIKCGFISSQQCILKQKDKAHFNSEIECHSVSSSCCPSPKSGRPGFNNEQRKVRDATHRVFVYSLVLFFSQIFKVKFNTSLSGPVLNQLVQISNSKLRKVKTHTSFPTPFIMLHPFRSSQDKDKMEKYLLFLILFFVCANTQDTIAQVPPLFQHLPSLMKLSGPHNRSHIGQIG